MSVTNEYLTEILGDPEYVAALQMVLPIINANKTVLNVSTAQYTELSNLVTAYTTQYGTANTAKAAAKSAVAQKDINKKATRTVINSWAKTWRANPAVPDALLESLLIAPHNVIPNHTPPSTPAQLVALADGQGYVELRWKKNGNKPGTQFVIEKQSEAGNDWDFAGVTTKSKFETSANPGTYIAYRVTAVRAGEHSNPTAAVVLWNNGQTGALRVAA
jgi:hypothetical protein